MSDDVYIYPRDLGGAVSLRMGPGEAPQEMYRKKRKIEFFYISLREMDGKIS